MSRSPSGPAHKSLDDRDLETRIEDCLTDVLSSALLRCERSSGRIGSDEKSFFCRSDLERIWSSGSGLVDIVFGHLSEGQRQTLLTDLLLFISFLVKIEVRPRFILSCEDVFFKKPESTIPKFKDDDGPRSEADLLQMGLTPRQANSWKEQYRFRPAKITFATERWEPQRIDPRIPLPFELTDYVHSGVMIHGGFGDEVDYDSQYGTVQLYTIPREYIENEIRASETWEPTAPLLRIVKSFSARQVVIEEAKNMELLKQSLVTNVNISIHDAIIEQRQEDDTNIVSIVSPYASLGDLAQFLAGGYGFVGGQWDRIYDVSEQFPRVSDTHQLRMSLLGQSKNLASALEFLHNGFTTKANDWKIKCAHLDLKPSNILIFESSQRDEVVGSWKLSDFGISVFGAEHLQGSSTVQLGSAGDYFMKFADTIRTSPKRIPGVYQAPEIEHPQPTLDDSSNPEHGARTSDIWSFGAIFAEVLAYAHTGASGVKRFDRRRRRRTTINGEMIRNDFFYTTTTEHLRRPSSTLPCILRREVSQWLEEFINEDETLGTEPFATGVCLRCWADCVKSILEVNPHDRPSAPTLSRWIADLHRHAKDTTIPHLRFDSPGTKRLRLRSLTEERNKLLSTPSESSIFFGFDTVRKSHPFQLTLSSAEVIDYDLDGTKLVYLTKKGIDFFRVNDPKSVPESERWEMDHRWRGIKVAEPYIVVWGSRPSHRRESAVSVYKISNGGLSGAYTATRSMYFNVTRRVAVSRQGLIAVIHNDEILVLDANDPALKELSTIKMVWQDPVGKFVDIAFDASGSTLYAWGNQYIYGVLFAYEFQEGGHGIGEEIYRGRFKNAFSEHKALVLPFNKHRECAIAVGPTPTSFFLGNIDQPRRDSSSASRKNSSSTGSERFTPQKFSDNPPGYHAWAGCTIQDSMLLVGATKKGLLSHRKVGICEQIIGADGRLRFPSKSLAKPSLETKTPWSSRYNPELNTEVKVGVIPSSGASEEHSIVVYYKKGVIEVLSYSTAERQQRNEDYDPQGVESLLVAPDTQQDAFGPPRVKSSLESVEGSSAHDLARSIAESIETQLDSINSLDNQRHDLARWSIAETTETQLDSLNSLDIQRPAALPKVVDIGSTSQGWLQCAWEIPTVVRELRESQSDGEVHCLLEDFVVISGSSGQMECSTCAEFLEKEWGNLGIKALEVLSQGVSLLENASKFFSGPNADRYMHIYPTDSYIILRVGENQQDAQSLIDAIVWTCTAIRINPSRHVNPGKRTRLKISKASQPAFIPGRTQSLAYSLESLAECSESDLGQDSSCWTGLFSSGIVASHSLRRHSGAGLKISFDMMVHLAGVENLHQIDGGFILIGFFQALVPISYDEDKKIVQWHFEEVDCLSDGLLKPHTLPSVRGTWYKTLDMSILRESECYVGWFANANILLGTHQLVTSPQNVLQWSTGTSEHHQSVRREGFEAAGQVGFSAGPVNTNFQLVRTWRFHSNVQHFHRHEQYSTALRLGRGNVAVIIDSDSKQLWLVPMLSVVLHLCHRYFQELNRGCQSHRNNPIPFADPSPDGASEAARVLEASGETLVFGSAGDPDAESLRQVFLRINNNLLNAAGTREPSTKKTIFASELMAMVTEPARGSPLKKIKAPADSEAWVGLLDRVDFVGVCSNIGHLIKPEPVSSKSPCTCVSLPSDSYLLAAHMRCLDALSEREGAGIGKLNSLNRICRLGDKVFWNADKVYWTSCPADVHEPIWKDKEKVLQHISCKETGKGKNISGKNGQNGRNGQTAPRQILPVDGAVVFGGDPSKSILQSWRFSEYIL